MATKERTTIGRGDECDIVLDGDTVSRIHCEIVCRGLVFILQDMSRNGTYVNGERTFQAKLNDGDQIRIGQNVLHVHLSYGVSTGLLSSKATTPHKIAPVIELKPHIVIKGLEEGVTQPFGEARITIGRRSDNNVVLEADNISRQHAAIERKDGRYFVSDMGSANGTFLNDARTDRSELSDGDRIRIGNFTVTVNLVEQDCILNFKKFVK